MKRYVAYTESGNAYFRCERVEGDVCGSDGGHFGFKAIVRSAPARAGQHHPLSLSPFPHISTATTLNTGHTTPLPTHHSHLHLHQASYHDIYIPPEPNYRHHNSRHQLLMTSVAMNESTNRTRENVLDTRAWVLPLP